MSSCLCSFGQFVVAGKKNIVDIYDIHEDKHDFIELPAEIPLCTDDQIVNIACSQTTNYIAVLTSSSKQILVYNLSCKLLVRKFILPRAASKVRFSPISNKILVADKTGDIFAYSLNESEPSGTKLLGHLSLLLDILSTNDEKFIISCDRDEKIRISCFPNTFNIQAYCLGHLEFVNHIELFPSDDNYLISTSGDGTIRIWDYKCGQECLKIDTNLMLNDKNTLHDFIQSMDKDAVEVTALPVVNLSVCCIDEKSSLLAVTLLKVKCVLLIRVTKLDQIFQFTLLHKHSTEHFSNDIILHNLELFICFDKDNATFMEKYLIKIDGHSELQLLKTVILFEKYDIPLLKCDDEKINILYKRKFDNVQEYQERKRQRLKKVSS